MRLVFNALQDVCPKHDWLISDLDCIWLDSSDEGRWPYPGASEHAPFENVAKSEEDVASRSVLVSGRELDEILNWNNVQFVWAVFSALLIGARPATEKAPYAEGNAHLWEGSPKPQLPEAVLEIVCWDSSCCLLIGASEELATSFRESFPQALDLDAQNDRRHLTSPRR
jgi:hypothetical protein